MKSFMVLIMMFSSITVLAKDLQSALLIYPKIGETQKYTVEAMGKSLPLKVMTMSTEASRELQGIRSSIDVLSNNVSRRTIAIEYVCASSVVAFPISANDRLGTSEDDPTHAVLCPQGGMMQIESISLPR